MAKSFKIIYGDNGAGKTKYYEEIQHNVDYICIDYNIGKWYDQKQKIISQRNFLVSKITNDIKECEKNIMSAKGISKYFGIKNSELKSFLVQTEFDKCESWHEYSLKNINNNVDQINLKDYSAIFDIWQNFEIYNINIKKLSATEFELLKIYSSLNYTEVNNLESKEAQMYQENILNIINELKLTSGIENIVELSKIDVVTLEKIRNAEIDISGISDIIKSMIVELEDVKAIFEMIDNKTKIEEKCLNFKEMNIKFPDEIKISEDGFDIQDIDLDKTKFSDGQKITFILKILLNVFSVSDKKILFDDIFEKLDISNTFNVVDNLLTIYNASKDMDIEILTHDVNFVDIFTQILDTFSSGIDVEYLILDNEKAIKTDHIFTFSQLLSSLYNDLNKKKSKKALKTYNNCLLLAKLFNRQPMHNNWVQIYNNNCSNDCIDKQFTRQVYEFLSENIFHYENEIDISKYNLIENYFDDEIFDTENLDTLKLYEKLIEIFENIGRKFGIDYKKVAQYLIKYKKFIECEKTYFDENKDLLIGKKMTKREFYRELDYKVNGEYYESNEDPRSERRRLAHILEKTIRIFK